jgi:hypothetical protein
MFYNEGDRVFSLSHSVGAVPKQDLPTVFAEFFHALFLAGVYVEGYGLKDKPNLKLSSEWDGLFAKNYSSAIGAMIADCLKERYKFLVSHSDVTPKEKELLTRLEDILSVDSMSFASLDYKDFATLIATRDFTDNQKSIIRLCGIMFARSGHPEKITVNEFRMSIFGDIYMAANDPIVLTAPKVTYRTPNDTYNAPVLQTTPIWALLSSMIDFITIGRSYFTGYGNGTAAVSLLVALLEGFSFLSDFQGEYVESMSVPRALVINNTAATIAADFDTRVGMVSKAHYHFLTQSSIYNNAKQNVPTYLINSNLIRRLFSDILNQNESGYDVEWDRKRLSTVTQSQLDYPDFERRITPNSLDVDIALEALANKPEQKDEEEETPEDEAPVEEADTPEEAPTEDQGDTPDEGDESQPADQNKENDDTVGDNEDTPPSQEGEDTSSDGESQDENPDATQDGTDQEPDPMSAEEKNNIDLIPTDRSGEGSNAYLYRQQVAALCKKLQEDDSVDVSPEAKAKLSEWVNSRLWVATVDATKDMLKTLDLDSFVENF